MRLTAIYMNLHVLYGRLIKPHAGKLTAKRCALFENRVNVYWFLIKNGKKKKKGSFIVVSLICMYTLHTYSVIIAGSGNTVRSCDTIFFVFFFAIFTYFLPLRNIYVRFLVRSVVFFFVYLHYNFFFFFGQYGRKFCPPEPLKPQTAGTLYFNPCNKLIK